MGVNVGRKVLTGAGVSVGTLARKLGALQPNPTTARTTNAINICLFFVIRYPLPQLSFWIKSAELRTASGPEPLKCSDFPTYPYRACGIAPGPQYDVGGRQSLGDACKRLAPAGADKENGRRPNSERIIASSRPGGKEADAQYGGQKGVLGSGQGHKNRAFTLVRRATRVKTPTVIDTATTKHNGVSILNTVQLSKRIRPAPPISSTKPILPAIRRFSPLPLPVP
jgi:hypothetical protein